MRTHSRTASFRTASLSRRRLLALAGGGAALAVTAPVSIAAPLPLSSTLDPGASPAFQAATEALVAAMGEHQVPGAAIGLLAGDREEHAVVGLASLSSMRPVTPETLFQIGSLTKTYTGTAIWRLIDEGALALDAPVRTYIPRLTLADEETASSVTVRNLLDHTAGWYGDEGFDTGDGDDAIARYVSERLPQLPQLFPLGAFFSYSNAAFTLLGRLIEVVTGTTYNAAMEHLLLGPLGLTNTVLDRDAVSQRHYADGHVALPINGKPAVAVQTPLWLPRSVDPAGGIWATTRDVIRYARFHLAQGTSESAANIVHPESLARMRTPAVDVPGVPAQMGLPWFVQEIAGTRVFRHGGDTPGQHTELVAVPEHGFALVVLTNGQGGGSLAATAALDAALTQTAALAPLAGQISLTAAPNGPAVDLSPMQLAEYAGRYADLGQAITIAERGSGLELTIEPIEQPGMFLSAINPPLPPPAAVAFVAEDTAVVNGQPLTFVRDPEGRVGWVAIGLRLVPHIDAAA